MAVDARHVVRRLEELRDRAAYVHDSPMTDQPYEAGKLERLSELADAEELRAYPDNHRGRGGGVAGSDARRDDDNDPGRVVEEEQRRSRTRAAATPEGGGPIGFA